jgi:hypothetical protein
MNTFILTDNFLKVVSVSCEQSSVFLSHKRKGRGQNLQSHGS